MKSICASLEDKLLTALRGLDLPVPVVGLLETAGNGEVKQEDLTALQLRVYGVQQPHEAHGMWQCKAELRLEVEQAESANGVMFRDAHEAVALWLERVMLADTCAEELDTDELFVDGFQLGEGGDADFDASGGVWYATWTVTLSGRLKNQTQEEN